MGTIIFLIVIIYRAPYVKIIYRRDGAARAAGARALVLDPIEGLTKDEEARRVRYVELMEANLRNLRTALAAHDVPHPSSPTSRTRAAAPPPRSCDFGSQGACTCQGEVPSRIVPEA